MQLLALGISHKTAEVELRERLSVSPTFLPRTLEALAAYPSIRGAVLLSTCNRFEVYADVSDIDAARADIVSCICSLKQVEPEEFLAHTYSFEDAEAVRHLFRVISSLDSMVLGEAQIIGQVRTAFKGALEAKTCTMPLSKLFRQALEVGKRVRNQTSISDAHVSLSTVAVDVALDAFPDLANRTVLVVGSGEMSELAARYLLEHGAKSLLVSSRTFAHACTLAKELGGTARYFEELEELINQADIVISSTAAPHCIITPELLKDIHKPILILDIALPRDVDPACGELNLVSLYDLDDLGQIAEQNKEHRRQAAVSAEHIVKEETNAFLAWIDTHSVVPTIKAMRARAEHVRAGEVAHLLRSLDVNLSEADKEKINLATSALVKKLLHEPTVRMRASRASDMDFECVEAARFLFGLTDDMKAPSHAREHMNVHVGI